MEKDSQSEEPSEAVQRAYARVRRNRRNVGGSKIGRPNKTEDSDGYDNHWPQRKITHSTTQVRAKTEFP
jgi:hypothetical protein